ncbi:sensor histidine kinase [Methylobacillus flagellatus]|nr:sensor histidine kinase [Methylobacillus flagellatus]
MLNRLLRFFAIVLLLFPLHAHALQVPHSLQKGIELDKIGAVSYLRDASGNATLQDIIAQDKAGAFRPLPPDWNAGYTTDTFWLKFTLDFPDIINNTYWLEISPATLDDVALYIPQPDQSYSHMQMGDHHPVNARPILHRNFIFPLLPEASAPAQTYYVRLRTTSAMNFHMTLWQPHIFISEHSRPDTLTGAYYGVRLFLALFAFILWLWLRHNIFILYSLYQCVTCSSQAFLSGTAQIALPIDPLTADVLQKSMNFLFMATVLIFYAALFQIKQHLPPLFRLTQGMIILELLLFIGVSTRLLPFNGPMTNVLPVINMGILACSSLWLLYHRHFDRLLYISAFWIAVGPYLLTILQNLGLELGPPTTVMDLPIIWSLLSLTLITLGIVNVAKREAEKRLQAKELALELSQESQRKLDQRVQERTEQLALANVKLNEEIKERQTLQVMLENSLEQQKELMQAQREFFAMASHEFRTPLAIIDTTSQRLSLLQSHPDLDTSTMLTPALRKIRRATQRMSRIIDNFLSMDRLEGVHVNQSFSQKPLDLCQVVQTTVEHYRDFSDRNIIVEPSTTTADVAGDQYLINLVISNLIDNALKYSPAGTDIIARVFHGQHFCHVEIQDFGPGIAPERQESIFEKYVRIEGNMTIHGTGLGLHVARRIAENHGGQLIVRSELGQGTCFRLTLPRHPE